MCSKPCSARSHRLADIGWIWDEIDVNEVLLAFGAQEELNGVARVGLNALKGSELTTLSLGYSTCQAPCLMNLATRFGHQPPFVLKVPVLPRIDRSTSAATSQATGILRNRLAKAPYKDSFRRELCSIASV